MPFYESRWGGLIQQGPQELSERVYEELSKKWHAKWISKTGLRARLWTDVAIRDFLSRPEDAGPINAWLREDVLRAESSPEFGAWMEKRRKWLAKHGKLLVPVDVPLPHNGVLLGRYRK